MNPEVLLQESIDHKEALFDIRHQLHACPGTGFDITDTLAFVRQELTAMGYEPQDCGKAGLVVLAGGKRPGKVFLLRGDMDGLPIKEEAEVPFRSVNGNMHACGHDLHTTMLLGAARLLKEHEDEIAGTVKLMFQPAEEIFEGAKDMIQSGVLKHPDVDAALMIHVTASMPMQPGTVIACSGGVSAPACDFFTIHIQGHGCHGSMPNTGIDPINAAAHIITAIQEINTRELAISDEAVVTIGTIHAGTVANVIPDTAEMSGSIRTFDEEVRQTIKTRITEIASGIAGAFRTQAAVSFGSGCPTLTNDAALSHDITGYLRELLGSQAAFHAEQLQAMSSSKKQSKNSGSEDFAYVSQEVPSLMLALAAGRPEDGYCYPQHHPKVLFDESVLPVGSAVYAYSAMRWLEEHS